MSDNPGLDYETVPLYQLTITATESREFLTTLSQVNVTVSDVNEPPEITNLPVSD